MLEILRDNEILELRAVVGDIIGLASICVLLVVGLGLPAFT